MVKEKKPRRKRAPSKLQTIKHTLREELKNARARVAAATRDAKSLGIIKKSKKR